MTNKVQDRELRDLLIEARTLLTQQHEDRMERMARAIASLTPYMAKQAAPPKKRPGPSAAGRRRIAIAQKKRWAAQKAMANMTAGA